MNKQPRSELKHGQTNIQTQLPYARRGLITDVCCRITAIDQFLQLRQSVNLPFGEAHSHKRRLGIFLWDSVVSDCLPQRFSEGCYDVIVGETNTYNVACLISGFSASTSTAAAAFPMSAVVAPLIDLGQQTIVFSRCKFLR